MPDRYLIDAATGCWNWTGAVNQDGYAQETIRSSRTRSGLSSVKVHRRIYEELVGPIAEGLVIDHKCRNARCVNPEHLEPVTNAENVRRGKSTKLSVEQVREIRSEYSAGNISQASLANRYRVSESMIRLIVRGKWWVVGIGTENTQGRCKQGRKRKLTQAEIERLFCDLQSGLTTQTAIAAKYKVSSATVSGLAKQFKRKQKENA